MEFLRLHVALHLQNWCGYIQSPGLCRGAKVWRWSAARRPVPKLRDPRSVMQEGRIGEYGVADAVLRCPRSPYTKTLLAALPRTARQ